MSFENLLRMRPNGVVSKNVIGKRNTFEISTVCIPFAATIVPSENIIDMKNCDATDRCVD
jgi:hypothetical protein